MDFEYFSATADEAGRRTDRVSRRILDDRGVRGSVFALLRKGLVRVNGQRMPPSHIIKAGDVICVASFLLDDARPPADKLIHEASGANLDAMATTLFRNEHLWVLSKKAGVCVQPDGVHVSLFDVLSRCSESRSLSFRLGCLHRIDCGTSGIVVFSQSAQGARWFSSMLSEGLIQRSYLAVAQGILPQGETLLCQPISGKSALTRVRCLAVSTYSCQQLSLVLAELETGRKHQIRIHLAQHGTPLLGDTRYGGIPLPEKAGAAAQFFLHAACMRLGDNPLGAPVKIRAPLPSEFLSFVQKTFGECHAIVEKFRM